MRVVPGRHDDDVGPVQRIQAVGHLDLQALVAADQPGARRALAHLVPRGRARLQGAEHGPGPAQMDQAHAVKGEHGATRDGPVRTHSQDGPGLSYETRRAPTGERGAWSDET